MNEKIVQPDQMQTNAAHLDCPEVVTEVRGQVGFITLNRPKALNALSLPMLRSLSQCLMAWRTDEMVKAVAFRGMGKGDATQGQATAPFGAFCAGGDIRFFHQAALAGNPALEDFFTEEYRLNRLIHSYPKPTVLFMDGIVMGGGMGLCGHGRAASGPNSTIRLVTERTKMAMPETAIGLFPDVGGGHFLSRCPGRTGEWLALTGETLGAADAVALGLADGCVEASAMPLIWDALGSAGIRAPNSVQNLIATYLVANYSSRTLENSQINHFFSLETVPDIVHALEASDDAWARQTAATLRKGSPLMLHVALAQIRRARGMTLADELCMERDMMHHCFNPRHLARSAATSETVEGIRALAIDKDHKPRWNPACIEDVAPEMVTPFFESPWVAGAHPLQDLL